MSQNNEMMSQDAKKVPNAFVKQPHIHTRTHTYIYPHTQTYTHTHTYTYIHTYTWKTPKPGTNEHPIELIEC